jgi:hypothetical protein
MSSPRPVQLEPEDADWGTDSLTGLIPPRNRLPQPPNRSENQVAAKAVVAPKADLALPVAVVAAVPPVPPLAALTPAPPPPAARRSSILRASYAILGLLAVGACWVLASRSSSTPTERPVASSAPRPVVASGASADRARARAPLEVRHVPNPTPKAAAAAFARGDYREALGQYRALAQLNPEQTAYPSLVRVLERRLTRESPGE